MTPRPTRPRKAYVYFGPRLWATIRRRYLAGESAGALAETFGCSEAAIRKRVQREGWGKKAAAAALDRLEPEAVGVAGADGGEAEAALDLDPRSAARRALALATRLLLQGQTARAAEAARVADVMARAAARLEGDMAGVEEPDEAAFEAVRRKVLGLNPPPQGEGDREAVEGVRRPPDGGERSLPGMEVDGASAVSPPPPPCGRSPSPCGGGVST